MSPDELRDHLRDHADDDDAWRALGDAIVANDPELAELVTRERAGAPVTLDGLSRKACTRWFGMPDAAKRYDDWMRDATWRSAHVVACTVNLLRLGFTLERCPPALELLQTLAVKIYYEPSLAAVRVLLSSVRSLDLHFEHAERTDVVDFLAPAERLRALVLRNAEPTAPGPLARVEALTLKTPWHDAIFECSFPALSGLWIDLLLARTPERMRAIFERALVAMPAIDTLSPVCGPTEPAAVLDAVLASGLGAKLRALEVRTGEGLRRVPAERLATWRGGAFAHLDFLALPISFQRAEGL